MTETEKYRLSFSEKEKLYLKKNRGESESVPCVSCAYLKKEGMKKRTSVDGKRTTSKGSRANG